MDEQFEQAAIEYHSYPAPGKISVVPTKGMTNQRDLALAYSPGVAVACNAIAADPAEAHNLTSRGNLVAVITNGTAVLGLGNIGALAGKPVMEGKGCLFKKFAGIDVFDIEIDATDPDKIIDIVAALEPTFGGINLEDIKAPECFMVERKLRERMKICRTAALGGHVEQCDDCGTIRIAYNSCRNRHCPKCQGLARAKWLADRAAELLPVPYFHVVFTLPTSVAEIAFHNKAAVYAILFRAAAETLIAIAADPRHLGARIGITTVLHTWGQTLTHHPHVHCIVPGGGPSLDGARWVACRPGFFLPVRVLARLFRRLFMRDLQKAHDVGRLRFSGPLAGLADADAFKARLAELRRIDWVVYAKPPFGGSRRRSPIS